MDNDPWTIGVSLERVRHVGMALEIDQAAPTPRLFARSPGVNRQRMQPCREFGAQKMVNYAVALYPALATKGLRNYSDAKMGSVQRDACAAPLERIGVACMSVRFIYDVD